MTLEPAPSIRPRAVTLAILAGALLHQAFKLASEADEERRKRQRDLRDSVKAFNRLRDEVDGMDHRCTFDAGGMRCVRDALHTGRHTVRDTQGRYADFRRDGRLTGVFEPAGNSEPSPVDNELDETPPAA